MDIDNYCLKDELVMMLADEQILPEYSQFAESHINVCGLCVKRVEQMRNDIKFTQKLLRRAFQRHQL